MKKKIELKEIDKEHWKFVLYETSQNEWIGNFVYSPSSFVDLSMLILLSEDEKQEAMENRNFLIELSDEIRDNYKSFQDRALKRENYKLL